MLSWQRFTLDYESPLIHSLCNHYKSHTVLRVLSFLFPHTYVQRGTKRR